MQLHQDTSGELIALLLALKSFRDVAYDSARFELSLRFNI
jgi:hypothetical protein